MANKRENYRQPTFYVGAQGVHVRAYACLDSTPYLHAATAPIAALTAKTSNKAGMQVIIMEGILVLHFATILERAHMRIFVDSDDDTRLARRIQRDVAQRGRDVASVINQYTRFVKPSHDEYIAPSRRMADIIIPWQRGDNLVAVDLIVGHLKSHLVSDVLLSRFPNLHLVESTFQMRGMHTIVRNRDTAKGDFIFMADRLIRLVCLLRCLLPPLPS
jgi:uridine kinase